MDREMQAHLDLLTAEYKRSGLPESEARLAARRRFGNLASLKERGRDIRGTRLLNELAQDLKYAARTLRVRPLFAATAILSVALGIGANTALFSVVDAAYLRKLPVANPDELIAFRWRQTLLVNGVPAYAGSNLFPVSTLNAFRGSDGTLDGLSALTDTIEVNATVEGFADTASLQLASGNYFSVLGLVASDGRLFGGGDDRPGADPAAVISHRYWERVFGRASGVPGRRVSLNGAEFTITGITPPSFHGASGLGAPDVTIPLAAGPLIGDQGTEGARGRDVRLIGRLKPDARIEQVRAEYEGMFQAIADLFNAAPGEYRAGPPVLEVTSASRGEPLYAVAGDLRTTITTLSVAFGLILLIACLNVGNLLLARGPSRDPEIGLRLAMGASRFRILRQLVTESVLLAVLAGMAGVILAWWGRDLLRVFVTPALDLRINLGLLLFALTVSLASGALFGLAPAIRAARSNPRSLTGTTGRTGGTRRGFAGWSLTIQVALSAIVLINATLLLRTLGDLVQADPGFDSSRLLVFRVDPEGLEYPERSIPLLYDEISARLERMPNVAATTTASHPLASSEITNYPVRAVGGSGPEPLAPTLIVSPNFFEMMDIPRVAGRTLDIFDDPTASPVAVVSERMANRLFGDEDPVGRQFRFRLFDGQAVEVVGVVGDVETARPGTTLLRSGTIYVSALQSVPPATTFLVRTRAEDAMTLLPGIRDALAAIDQNLAVMGATTQDQIIRDGLASFRRLALTWTILSSIALALIAIGLYGLTAYGVAQRTHEIGIRTALGARPIDITRLTAIRSFRWVVLGLLVGFSVYYLQNRLIVSMSFGARFGVPPLDLATIVFAAVSLIVVTGVASFVPAHRASRAGPLDALREIRD